MGEFEDAIKQLRAMAGDNPDLDEVAEVFEKYTGTQLRKKAERAIALEEENVGLKTKLKKYEVRPRVEEALTRAGVDFGALRPAEKKAIESLEPEGDPSEDWAAKVIEDYGFPTKASEVGEQETSTPEPSAAAVARQAKGAPVGGAATSGVITPEEFAGWPLGKRIRFIEAHPEAEETLGRGQPVVGIAFS